MRRSRRAVLVATPLVAIAAAIAVRFALEPRESPPPAMTFSPSERARLGVLARAALVPPGEVRAGLAGVDVLLVGEEHFYREPVQFLCDLLEGVEGRRVSLLLELSSDLQPHVDEWILTGRSAALEQAMREGQALPYGEVLSWA